MDLGKRLNQLRKFYRENDRLPSLGEAAELFRVSSRNSAKYVIDKLIESNFIEKGPKGKLITTPKFKRKFKLLGTIAAGLPTDEEQEVVNSIALEEYLVERPEATFLLEVKGDSMINAGILPNDYVLIEKGKSPKIGEIVIANIDGEWTMKYYRNKNGKPYLEAANPKYRPIHPQHEFKVGGVVVGVVRKY